MRLIMTQKNIDKLLEENYLVHDHDMSSGLHDPAVNPGKPTNGKVYRVIKGDFSGFLVMPQGEVEITMDQYINKEKIDAARIKRQDHNARMEVETK